MNLAQTDIIYFTLFPWDHPYSSVSLSFTRAFAQQHRVFYINPPFSMKEMWERRNEEAIQTRFSEQWQRKIRYETIPSLSENVVAVHPPAVLPINFLPQGNLYNALQQWNEKVVLNSIKKVIEKYNIQNYIYLNCFNPSVAGVLPASFRPLLNIYQCIDDMAEEEYTKKHWLHLENEVIEKADICVVTSRKLRELKQPLNPETHILHNAVDDTIFSQTIEQDFPRPSELEGIKTPIIGFTGNMDGSRIDYELLQKIAMHHSDKTLVLVGPTNSEDYLKFGLDKMENIVFTGSKNIKELPSYLQHFDCTIIPFLKNQLTASIYPLKINEYLFSGKPVISTNFSEDIRGFREVIYLSDSHPDFLTGIDRALQKNDEAKASARIEVARSNTWNHRVEEFWEIVHQYLA